MLGSYLPQFPFSSTEISICTGAQSLAWSSDWSLLGPFQLGTREAEWGCDPLEAPEYGGFLNLTPNTNCTFRSSLSRNGTVSWSSTKLNSIPTLSNSCAGVLTIEFGDGAINWPSLRDIYGWSGVQFQAWSRGYLHVCPSSEGKEGLELSVAIQIDPVLEFYIDGKQYFGGDMYSYRRAPLILYLQPGKHQVNIRITHDIRAFGGDIPPKLDLIMEAKEVTGNGLVAAPEETIISDVVGGVLAGQWASIPVRNEGKYWTKVISVESVHSNATIAMVPEKQILRLAPGQSRPLKFRISEFRNATSLSLKFYFKSGENSVSSVIITVPLNHKPNVYSPHVFTFLHPSGVVSYAALRPPSVKSSCSPELTNKIPVLLTLHGAGVDVRWVAAQSTYNALPDLCAWLLFPQGVTLWSGDDWHNWGFAGVEAAVAAIPDWMNQNKWNRQGADLNKWVVTGHSNGGQGTWYALTHRSDKIIAATPLSGYLSIPAYVPYHMWHEADPRMTAIVMASLSSYKHELLVENFAGTPIHQLHGELDDNVPAFHSRRMAMLAAQSGSKTIYHEAPRRGHWWEGIMTEASLSDFLKYYVNVYPQISRLSEIFSIIVANPGNMGPRGGISVDQLESYEQLGHIDVKIIGDTWVCTTNNIRRLHLDTARPGTPPPKRLSIDGQNFNAAALKQGLLRLPDGNWMVSINNSWQKAERHSSQLGGLNSFLNCQGPFRITLPRKENREEYHESVALSISRSLYQYFAADSEIVGDGASTAGPANVVLFNIPKKNFPIVEQEKKLLIKTASGKVKALSIEPGLGVIFTKPLPEGGLALVIWGADEEGLRAAARLFPLRTGVGQPDFAVLGRKSKWKGVAGAKAMGMYDSEWRIQDAAFGL